MIVHEDNFPTIHQAPPSPKPVPSWATKPWCDWRFFTSSGEHEHKNVHGVKLQNVPGPVVEITLDRLQTLRHHDSGLGELARHIDARLMAMAKILNADGSLAQADLYFTIHKDPGIRSIHELFDTILREEIVPYLEVHHWPVAERLRCPETDKDRFKAALPDAHALRELMENFAKIIGSPIGQSLALAWARMVNDTRGDPAVYVRVQGTVEVTIGDGQDGTLKHEAQIDQMLHQSIYAPIVFYLQKH